MATQKKKLALDLGDIEGIMREHTNASTQSRSNVATQTPLQPTSTQHPTPNTQDARKYKGITIKIDKQLDEKLDFIKFKFKNETSKRDKQDVISAAIEDFLLKYYDPEKGLTIEGYDRVGRYIRGGKPE